MASNSRTPSGSSSRTSIRESTISQMVQGIYPIVFESVFHPQLQCSLRPLQKFGESLRKPSSALPNYSTGSSTIQNSLFFHPKPCNSLDDTTFCLRNNAQSTIRTTPRTEPDTFSITLSILNLETGCLSHTSVSVENGTASSTFSALCPSLANALSFIIDIIPAAISSGGAPRNTVLLPSVVEEVVSFLPSIPHSPRESTLGLTMDTSRRGSYVSPKKPSRQSLKKH